MELLMKFYEKEQKEKIFDKIILPKFGVSYKDRWIDDTKIYSYGKENNKFLLEVSKPAGVILRQYFQNDIIGELFNIKWSNVFGN